MACVLSTRNGLLFARTQNGNFGLAVGTFALPFFKGSCPPRADRGVKSDFNYQLLNE